MQTEEINKTASLLADFANSFAVPTTRHDADGTIVQVPGLGSVAMVKSREASKFSDHRLIGEVSRLFRTMGGAFVYHFDCPTGFDMNAGEESSGIFFIAGGAPEDLMSEMIAAQSALRMMGFRERGATIRGDLLPNADSVLAAVKDYVDNSSRGKASTQDGGQEWQNRSGAMMSWMMMKSIATLAGVGEGQIDDAVKVVDALGEIISAPKNSDDVMMEVFARQVSQADEDSAKVMQYIDQCVETVSKRFRQIADNPDIDALGKSYRNGDEVERETGRKLIERNIKALQSVRESVAIGEDAGYVMDSLRAMRRLVAGYPALSDCAAGLAVIEHGVMLRALFEVPRREFAQAVGNIFKSAAAEHKKRLNVVVASNPESHQTGTLMEYAPARALGDRFRILKATILTGLEPINAVVIVTNAGSITPLEDGRVRVAPAARPERGEFGQSRKEATWEQAVGIRPAEGIGSSVEP